GRTLSGTKRDAFVAFYDKKGIIKWVRSIGGPNDDFATGVCMDGASNVFVAGTFSGTANIGANQLTSAGNTDIFVAEFDAFPRLLWALSTGGAGADSSSAVFVNHDDNACITGSIRGKVNFGNIMLNVSDSGSFFLAKLEQNPAGI